MEGFPKAMMRLTRAMLLLELWTIITVITLIGIMGLNFILPLLLNEPFFYTIIYTIVYAVILAVMLIGNRMVKDLQKSITIVFVRAFVGFILPIPLILLAFTLLLKILFVVFTIISLVILVLTFIPINALLKIQKQLST